MAVLLWVQGCGRPDAAPPEPVSGAVAAPPVARIVSLAPSITEVLFELGLGPRVVGVTTFCDYPPEATAIAKVGGLLDPNIEAIVTTRPDLVLLFDHHSAALTALQALGVPCATVQGDTMDQVLESIEVIATRCGIPERGAALSASLRARVRAVAQRPRPQPAPRVLVSVGRTLGGGHLQDVYVAGEDGFFSELIRLAGGRNACPEKTIRFPMVAPEGLIEMQPDVVIELAADLDRLPVTAEDVVREWDVVREVPAVRLGQVQVFTEDYVTVPGPRFVLLLEHMAEVIATARTNPPAKAGERSP